MDAVENCFVHFSWQVYCTESISDVNPLVSLCVLNKIRSHCGDGLEVYPEKKLAVGLDAIVHFASGIFG